jgi:hypothetical protein
MPAKSSAKTKVPVAAARAQKAPPLKSMKIGKRLEAVAREVKDADEFVEHVAGLANRYRREQALASADTQAELRQTLRTFHKHASALVDWLQRADAGKPSAIERKALDAIGTKLHGSPVLARAPSKQALEWLTRAGEAAHEIVAGMKRTAADSTALQIAAEGLRATFEHHKLKVTLAVGEQPSDAVRLLCAIARDAGDDSVEPTRAKIALRDTNRPRVPGT